MINIVKGWQIVLLLGPFTAARVLGAENAEGYSISGIMGSDPGKAFAVIENAAGEQNLVSEGNAVGSGYVKSISAQHKTVILAFPDGDVELRLTGSRYPDTASAAKEEAVKAYSITDYDEEVAEQKTLDPTAISKLQKLANDTGKLTESQLSVQLNEALGLPEEARIAAYEEQAVPSIRELLVQMSTTINEPTESGTFLGKIAVSDRYGSRRVYLMTGTRED